MVKQSISYLISLNIGSSPAPITSAGLIFIGSWENSMCSKFSLSMINVILNLPVMLGLKVHGVIQYGQWQAGKEPVITTDQSKIQDKRYNAPSLSGENGALAIRSFASFVLGFPSPSLLVTYIPISKSSSRFSGTSSAGLCTRIAASSVCCLTEED